MTARPFGSQEPGSHRGGRPGGHPRRRASRHPGWGEVQGGDLAL